MKYFVLMAALLLTPFTNAAQASGTSSISWIPPTEYVDGSPLDENDIDKYIVSIGNTSGNYSTQIEINSVTGVADAEITIPVSDVQNGDTVSFFVVMQTVMNGTNCDGAACVSAYSNEVSKEFLVSIIGIDPNPPTVQSVTFDIICTVDAGVTCTFTQI